MEKLKTKVTIDAFRATQSMLPLIPTPRIVQIDEGSHTQKPNNILEEPLIPPLPEIFMTEFVHQIISSIAGTCENPQDKRKQIATDSDSSVKMFRKSEGWSSEHIDLDLEESIQIQALKRKLESDDGNFNQC